MNRSILLILILLLFCATIIPGQGKLSAQEPVKKFTRYLAPSDINNELDKLKGQYTNQTRLTNLATSSGGMDIKMLEIGAEIGLKVRKNPAILVVANMEGNVPISSLGALYMAYQVLEEKKYQDITWYILPASNPDAAQEYFKEPRFERNRNGFPHNDDMDELTDEDGFDDLNGDGQITQMRVKEPTGEWIIVEGNTRMMKKADPIKGELGIYKLYTEGLDNDGDGTYNEDGLGGVNPAINFPHLWKFHTVDGGLWPGSINETFQLMKFAFEHPEIAMTISLGSTNFCLVPPKGGRQGEADFDNIKIPKNFADMFGADPNKSYKMQEIIDMVQPMVPAGMELTESMVASFLGLGAVVNPIADDLKFYNELSEKYKKYLEEKGFKEERLDPKPAKDGSFELWAYYHLGIPSFSMNLWTLPEVKEEKKEESGITVEKLEKMTDDEFIELGEEKITAFLKEVGAPPEYKAEMVINMVKSGQMGVKQIAGMVKQMPKPKDTSGGDPEIKALIAFSDKHMEGKGFIEWKAFDHPTLGKVEIGGAAPFATNTPPANMIDSLLKIQVPYLVNLTGELPRLVIADVKVTAKGGGVYQVDTWIRNNGFIPFPTAMGERNQQPAPAVITIEGGDIEFLSGKARTPVNKVGGNKTVKHSWMVHSDKPSEISILLRSKSAWGDEKQIKLGGSK